MKRVELTKDVGPYTKGQTLTVDDKSAAQLIESKRAKAVDDKTAQGSEQDA